MDNANIYPLTAEFSQALSKIVSDIYTLRTAEGKFLLSYSLQMHIFKIEVFPHVTAQKVCFLHARGTVVTNTELLMGELG